ncbi:DUF1983 domain-containing protein [Escherichia coli]|nr:DUF1983 domain-containing protein [Escherichia coli]
MAIAEVDRKVDRMGSEIRQTVSRSTEENSRQIAQIRQYVDDKGSQIKQSTDKKLGSWNASIEQIQKVQEDTRRNLNSMWAVKLQQTRDGRLYIAGIGAGIENTSDGIQSQILMQADRIAMINPENGNTTPGCRRIIVA